MGGRDGGSGVMAGVELTRSELRRRRPPVHVSRRPRLRSHPELGFLTSGRCRTSNLERCCGSHRRGARLEPRYRSLRALSGHRPRTEHTGPLVGQVGERGWGHMRSGKPRRRRWVARGGAAGRAPPRARCAASESSRLELAPEAIPDAGSARMGAGTTAPRVSQTRSPDGERECR